MLGECRQVSHRVVKFYKRMQSIKLANGFLCNPVIYLFIYLQDYTAPIVFLFQAAKADSPPYLLSKMSSVVLPFRYYEHVIFFILSLHYNTRIYYLSIHNAKNAPN